jgi:predicted phosphoadenosine phosphosulfate sulfurtransferase
LKTWKSRCYLNGIPDEAPMQLEKINRVPSYRCIAMAILNNDLMLRSIGFYEEEGDLAKELRQIVKNKNEKQLSLFK